MAYHHQPGISIGIIHDQDLVWAKGFGHRDVEHRLPATTGTIYRIASITKTFTAMAVMQLRDAGQLQLDDPVAKHLPWFLRVAPHRRRGGAAHQAEQRAMHPFGREPHPCI